MADNSYSRGLQRKSPGWIDEINFIEFALLNTCGARPWAYIKTALPAVGNLVVNILDFGTTDLVRAFFRPEGCRHKRHGTKGPEERRRGGIPQLEDLIAEHLPGRAKLASRQLTGPDWAFWEIVNPLERALWYFFIVDAVKDAAYQWASTLIQMNSPRCQLDSSMLREGEPTGWLGSVGFDSFTCGTLVYENNLVSTTATCTIGEGLYFAGCSVQVPGGSTDQSGKFTMRVQATTNDGEFIVGDSGEMEVSAGTPFAAGAAGLIKGPGYVSFLQKANFSAFPVTGRQYVCLVDGFI